MQKTKVLIPSAFIFLLSQITHAIPLDCQNLPQARRCVQKSIALRNQLDPQLNSLLQSSDSSLNAQILCAPTSMVAVMDGMLMHHELKRDSWLRRMESTAVWTQRVLLFAEHFNTDEDGTVHSAAKFARLANEFQSTTGLAGLVGGGFRSVTLNAKRTRIDAEAVKRFTNEGAGMLLTFGHYYEKQVRTLGLTTTRLERHSGHAMAVKGYEVTRRGGADKLIFMDPWGGVLADYFPTKVSKSFVRPFGSRSMTLSRDAQNKYLAIIEYLGAIVPR